MKEKIFKLDNVQTNRLPNVDRVEDFLESDNQPLDNSSFLFKKIADKKSDLLNSEQEMGLFSLLANTTENGLLFTDAFGKIIWVNHGFCTITGFAEKEIIGQTLTEFCKGELTSTESLKKIVAGFYEGKNFTLETLYYRKDKVSFWGRSKVQAIKEKDGKLIQYFVTVEDISTEKEKQERLSLFEKDLRFAFEKVGDNVWEHDYRTGITIFTQHKIDFLGCFIDEGTDINQLWWSRIHPDDKNVLLENDRKCRNGESNHHMLEYRMQHRDGGFKWVLDRGVVTEKNIDGTPLKIIGTHTDITSIKNTEFALQESEKRWQFALEGNGDGIWDWNITNQTVFLSKLWKQMLGYEEEEIHNEFSAWESRLHPDDYAKTKKELAGYLDGSMAVYQNEHRLLCKDGSYKWILSRGMAVERDAAGQPQRMIGTHTDITYIKQTDKALEQRVQQFQGLSENIPGVIFEYEARADGSFGYKYISPAMEKIFGIRAEDFFDYKKFVHPDDLMDIDNGFKYSAETLHPYYNESRLILPGRGIVWRSISCSFSYFSESGAKVFTGLMLDVSQRKKGEEKISESENRLSSLIANLQTGVLVEDESRRVILANELYCSLFDIAASPAVLKGVDCSSFAEQTKIFFKQPEKYIERIHHLLAEKKLMVNDLLELIDGRIFSRDFVPIYSNNIYKGQLWKYTDVTSQKNAEDTLRLREEKYRSIIANMNLGLMEVDIEEKILFVNQSFCDMSGFEMEELIGKRGSELFVKGDSIELMERKNEARQKGHSDAYEVAVKNKRGQLRWWLISGAPRYNDEGDLIGSIGIHLDITTQKQLEIDLIEANEAAEQSTRSKEVFLANMSHEIRTPMNAIIGMTNQMAKTTLDSKQLFCIDTIASASENLLVIINDILDLSKIEAGKLSLEKIGFEPKAVISRAIQVLMHKAEEKGLVLHNSSFDESIAPVLLGDPYRINQVLLNIISNAIKFTEKGSVIICCKLLKSSFNYQELQFDITDTGIGMDSQFVASLFEKFSQEDASVTRQYGGTGLGMSICRDLIGLMGGNISVKSKKGEGTCISFVIEFSVGNVMDLPNKEIFIADEGMLTGKKILVVDDNEMNRLVATTILNDYGAATFEAGNGKEAMDFLIDNTVDIVLMDLQMPVMNGFEATRSIRKNISTTLPIIALTANAIKGDREKCIEVGMDEYVTKPFKEEDLMKIVASQLKLHTKIIEANMEEKTTTLQNYYDLTDIKTISRGNDDFVKKMLKMFVEQTPVHVLEMRERFDAKDLAKLGEIAHKIKPTIDSMGIKTLKNIIREIEKIGKAGIYDDALPGLLGQVETDLQHAINAIKSDFQIA